MTTPNNFVAGLSRAEKQERLRKVLAERISRSRVEPVSFAQEGLWFLNRLQPDSPFYNINLGVRLHGALDVPAIERAFGEIVRRHEPLRTTFAERDGTPVQVIAPFSGFSLAVQDLSGGDEESRAAEVERQVSAWVKRPFDLAAGPLFRAVLLRLGEEEHVLVLSMHHTVSDGWSMGVLFGELSALYEAYQEGRESPLAEPRMRYADFAVQQRERLQGATLERELAYWRERLAGAPALLELPTDRARPAVQSNRGARERMEVPAHVVERLRALAQREGATLYIVLLAAFQVLLSKYSGSEDVVVGSPVSGRTRSEMEELIGYFINTLVLRTDLSGDPSFREVLGRVREVALGAYEHQELSFETLVAELHPERSLSYSPVFQVLFSLHTAAEGSGPRLAGLRTESAYTDSETAKFDLNMVLDEDARGLQAALGYSTDLFDEGTIRRMLAHLGRVLEQVATEPDLRLSELRLLGEAERQRVLVEWNATEAEYPRELCTHHLFEAQVERTPHAVAVVAEGETLTFAELNARANRLAHHLIGLGVGPDVRVGICIERSLEMAVGLLAVVKAGGAYVPLDPDYPADRLRHMVEDAAPAALLAYGVPDALVAGLMDGSTIRVIRFETDAEAWADRPDTNPVTDVRPGHLVYVIYTSGSTGRPKGVMNHHACLVNRLTWGARAWSLAADDVLLCKTSLSFDGHIREIFLPWSVGARVVMARPGGQKDLDYLLEVIHDGGATMVNLNGSLLMLLLEHPRIDLLAGLRQMLVGGESFSGTGLTRFLERVPGTRLHHLYGPSEAATAMMAPDLGPAQARRVVPIGRPTANSRLYLLDPAGNPVPVGVVGEMYLGGHSVGRGYLDRPALTAERFVPDPFAAEPGARLYRTGDLGRWLADGMMEFLGRNDFQVKIRGFRIELGEVEARLREHPRVGEAAVMARPDATGENRLIAWYTSDEAVDPAALRAHLAERLPDYMVPAAFVRMESFPLTPSVKLDRKALPDPQGDAFVTSVYESPVGDTEVALAEIWADVLGAERVGRRDHFFELGGHSLRAVQVVSRVRQVLEAEVPLGEIFLKPVLADFARALEQAARTELPVIAPVDRARPLPLSFAQQRLWFVEQMGETGTAYHVPKWLRLTGRLNGEALRQALDRIVARHEALRTSIAMVSGEPVQRITPVEESAFHLREDDLIGHPDAAAEVRRIMDEEADALFDLVRAPLIRGRLVRLAPDDQLLLVTMHHIVSDGWSMGVLIHELGTLYTAFLRGSGDPLPPLEIQYADYAVWQRRWVEGDVLRQQADYWKASLTGAPERLEVPLDRPRPAQQDFAGGTVGLELDEELTAGLKALSRRHGTTLFMTLLAGWAAVLSRLSGQGEVVVGTPAANRGRREIEGLIGFFINTLALRLDLSGGATVAEVLARVKARVLGAQQHQDIPFEQVVDLVQPARTLAHSPLFQAIFVWQNTPRTAMELPELTVGPVDWQPQLPAKYDLSLALSESGGRIRGGVVYATSLFERQTVERWTGYLENALRAMVADEGRRVGDLPLLPEVESRMMLQEWNRTETAYPRSVCIHELFEAQVRERPDAEALVWGDASLTYKELDARANRLAHLLVRQGVGPDARVGVLLERSAELIVSVLAVLKAGGCYVPLDPSYPSERLRLMLADSDARVLLSRSDLVPVVSGADARILCLDRLPDEPAAEPVEAPRGGATAENLAYIVYTSGSTGKPKGVMVAHRHVVQLVRETDYVRFCPGDRIAQASNASFDALTFEAWGAFLNGATLVGIDREVLLSTPALRTFLREARITTLYQTTALLNQLAREQPDIFSPLREVLFGGQAADADGVRRLLRAGGPRRLLHMYGPTETTAWCSWEQVEHVAEDALTVSVGRPTANQRIYLLDAALNPVPESVPGEAYVGGDGVVRGYLNRPGLTADRFLPDPFAVEPGARMYRTGDRLRWKTDGRLEFIGRVDEQVKIRGFRIEPGEVEGVLGTHPWVDEVRVIVREDQPGEQRLVAYVVGEVNVHELFEHLRERLPEYMVPAAIVLLEALPLTPNGKLDLKGLPAPEYTAVEAERVAPRTLAEEVLAGVWADVLRLERVGVKDNFFELGGHSLLATRVVSRVRAVFGVELPLRVLFEGPTVAELAMAVEEERRRGAPVLPPVVPVRHTAPLPLSFAQERLWFLDRLDPGSTTYNIPVVRRLEGPLDGRALERALAEIIQRHESLRTVFREAEGSAVQVVAPFTGFSLPVEDLSRLTETAREAKVRRIVAAEAVRPFDLITGPLFRAGLLRLRDDEHVLLISMHHIVSDGWSMGVLFRELAALYEAHCEGRESPLPEPAVQYADYAAWQREHLRDEVLERQLAYWRERLADAPALLELPTDHPRLAVQTFRGAYERFDLPGDLLEGLRELGRSEGATLYMVVLAAFQALLARYSGSGDVVVGSPIAGRTRREVEDLIGLFVNTLVMRSDLSGDPSFREVLARVREATLGAYDHQELPFEKLVAELQPERSLSHSPLFQVVFTLQNGDQPVHGLVGVETRTVEAELATTKFDLTLGFTAHLQGLRGVMTYSTDLFERGTIVRMLGHLRRVLEQVALQPDVSLSALELLGAAEREQVLDAWNDTARAHGDPPVHVLFAEWAARTPQAIALLDGPAAVTYEALDRRAATLARHLRALGVGPETPVGLCTERTPELLVGVLGIWKAGGAYVPLDPSYPAERLGWIVADAALPVVVATEGTAGVLPEHGATVVLVDRLPETAWEAAPEVPASDASLAYVIYTSGSTGRPKGVLVPHGSLANLLAATREAFGVGPGDVMPALASYAFDIWLFEALLPLTSGAAVRLVERERVMDVPALVEEIADATLVHAVPALMRQLVQAERDTLRLGRLRRAFVGGDQVAADLLAEMRTTFPVAETHVLYGPTEGTILASTHPVPEDGIVAGHPIGRPLGNVRLYVCDALGSAQPAGVPGELLIGGAGVARGYLGRPALTAERFVPDPFSAEPGARLYRTGDRTRWRGDGTLEYLGRLDAQVKIRGFRIEPGEIEEVLRKHERVAECVVVVCEDEAGDRRLVAYVAGDVTAEALREHVRRSLPEYMVPATFVVLDQLPLTPNGKLDRKALPAPAYAAAAGQYVAPRTPVEEVLAGIWVKVLKVERVGVNDGFFELGGHSLLIMRLLSQVQAAFGLEISIRAVFSMPTLEAMAGEIERRIYEDVAALSDDEIEQLVESTPVAGV